MTTTRSPRRRTEPPKPATKPRPSKRGEPLWEMALHAPLQGEWTVEDYLPLSEARVLVELVDGCVEYLPMPDLAHQFITKYLLRHLMDFAEPAGLGLAAFAPCPIQLNLKNAREPDVFLLFPERIKSLDQPPKGADLVMEVVSPGEANRKRDFIDKRRDYAKAGIKEYWIVDPQKKTITVLALKKRAYKTHGEFTAGMTATSVLLPGFTVDVDAVFAAGGRRA